MANASVNNESKGWTPLHVSAWNGDDTSVLEIFTASHGTLNSEEDTCGMSPLHIAVWKGHASIVSLLLQFRADLNSYDKEGTTPVDYAMKLPSRKIEKAKCDAIVNHLLYARASFPESSLAVSARALQNAAWDGDNCRILEVAASSTASLNEKDASFGMTPLHMAVCRSHVAVVKTLLELRADYNQEDADGATPIDYAKKWSDGSDAKQHDILKLLTSDSAEIDGAASVHVMADTRETPEWDLLHLAAWDGDETVVNRLLSESGANVDAKETRHGMTCMHIAAWRGHLAMVEVLLRLRADCKLIDSEGANPLQYATKSASKHGDEVVRLLISANASVDLREDVDIEGSVVTRPAKTRKVSADTLWHPLHIAAWSGDVTAVHGVVSEDKDHVNSKEETFGMTPLHIAIWNGHASVVAMLLKCRADFEQCDKNGGTPLYYAVSSPRRVFHSCDKIVSQLVKAKICVAPHEDGTRSLLTPAKIEAIRARVIAKGDNPTLLHDAASMGDNLGVVEILTATRRVLNAADKERGWTPLHCAISRNYLSVVDILLQFRADCEVRAFDGRTPLHLAAQNRNSDFVASLLQHGAAVEVFCLAGYTPLSEAAYHCRDDVVKILVGVRASIWPQGSGTGDALAAARVWQKRSLHIAEFLATVEPENSSQLPRFSVEAETASLGWSPSAFANMKALMTYFCPGSLPQTSLEYKDSKQRSLLHHASLADSADAVRNLLAQHIDAEACDEIKCTPLLMSAMHARMNALSVLLEWSVDVNVRGLFDDSTPLHQATFYGWHAVVERLLEHRASTCIQDRHGATPLYYSASMGRADLLKLFLQVGAEIHVQSVRGWTPLAAAAFRNREAVVCLLLAARADHSVADVKGAVSIHHAAFEGHESILRCLLEARADSRSKDNEGRTPCDYAKKRGHSSLQRLLSPTSE